MGETERSKDDDAFRRQPAIMTTNLTFILQITCFFFCTLIICLSLFPSNSRRRARLEFEDKRGSAGVHQKDDGTVSDINSNDRIRPLQDYDFRSVPPIRYRPYEIQGHVTMGIRKMAREDWIRIDRRYTKRLEEREMLLTTKPQYTIGTGALVDAAIEELYLEVMADYLPKRYPSLFEILDDGTTCKNMVTGGTYPLDPAHITTKEMLRLMGLNVEEDFYIMCPDSVDGSFRLQGYIACFPGGFLTPARVGESVRELHKAVPGYEDRLGNSVDRYFSRMQPGQFIGRMNWSLQVDGEDLFRTDGNNYYPGGDTDFDSKYQPNFEDCYLRVEHQTLCALPRSRAIIFCVRSYMTPLVEIRDDGEGRQLADAIDSMPEKLGQYKMRHFWGDAVLPWLRSKPEQSVAL